MTDSHLRQGSEGPVPHHASAASAAGMSGEPIQEPLSAGLDTVRDGAIAAAGLSCRRCRAGVPVGVTRCACGCFLTGNSNAVTHGAYRALDRPDLRALIEAERSEVLEAMGGEAELAPQMLRVLQSYAEHAVLRDAALTKVLDEGLVTAKGNTRAIVKVFRELDEAMVKRAQLLGLERRTKRVANPLDYISGKVEG